MENNNESNNLPKDVYQDARNFEGMQMTLMRLSAKRGWTVALFFGGAWILTLIALVLLMPLKETVPFVIAVDDHGNRNIITELNDEVISANEALIKHDVYEYVKLREKYNWETLAKDFGDIQIFSSIQVNNELSNLYNPETGLQTKLGSKHKIEVDYKTIVLSKSAANDVATVRIRTRTYSTKTNDLIKVENKIITMTYMYDAERTLRTSARLINPLGFTVTSYRLDEEL